MSESRLSPTAYVLIGIAIGGLAGACAAGADQPNMQAALGSLQQARSYLVQSTPNKGGHRERAIQFRRPGDQPDRGRHRLRRQLRRVASFIEAELKDAK